jgi:tight adherence protein B
MAPLLAILTFVVVVIVFLAFWLFASTDTQQEQIRRRMESVGKAERRGGETSPVLDLLRDEMLSEVPAIHRVMMRFSWSGRLRDLIEQSGMRTKPGKIVMFSCVLALGAYVAARVFHVPLWGCAAAGLALGAIPFAVIVFKRNRRMRQFEERFPEALDLLGRAVRAGHAFTTGMEMIGKESPEPIAGEFRKTFEEQNFGLPIRDALLNMTDRVPLVDVRFFVTALLVQKETGGNLAEILDNLARVIRDRFRIYREVRTKTAQGRLTAIILIALPPAMMAILSIINPAYIRVLFEDPKGPTVLAIAGALQLIGSAIIWKIIHIEV